MYKLDVSNVLFSLLDDEPKTSNDDGSRPVHELTPVSSMSSIFTPVPGRHVNLKFKSMHSSWWFLKKSSWWVKKSSWWVHAVVSTLDRGSIYVRHLTCPQSSSHPLPLSRRRLNPVYCTQYKQSRLQSVIELSAPRWLGPEKRSCCCLLGVGLVILAFSPQLYVGSGEAFIWLINVFVNAYNHRIQVSFML